MLKLLQYCNYIIIVMQIKLMLLLLTQLTDLLTAFIEHFPALVSHDTSVICEPKTNQNITSKSYKKGRRSIRDLKP